MSSPTSNSILATAREEQQRTGVDAYQRPGTRARNGRGREAEVASSLRTIAHLEGERDKQKALGRTALAEYTQARINAIQTRIASYQP